MDEQKQLIAAMHGLCMAESCWGNYVMLHNQIKYLAWSRHGERRLYLIRVDTEDARFQYDMGQLYVDPWGTPQTIKLGYYYAASEISEKTICAFLSASRDSPTNRYENGYIEDDTMYLAIFNMWLMQNGYHLEKGDESYAKEN